MLDDKDKEKSHGLFTTFKSVGSAFFGVQSDKNREQDFNKGKLSHFIIAGIISALLFVLMLVMVVNIVLP